jgi:hypothetical protein
MPSRGAATSAEPLGDGRQVEHLSLAAQLDRTFPAELSPAVRGLPVEHLEGVRRALAVGRRPDAGWGFRPIPASSAAGDDLTRERLAPLFAPGPSRCRFSLEAGSGRRAAQ